MQPAMLSTRMTAITYEWEDENLLFKIPRKCNKWVGENGWIQTRQRSEKRKNENGKIQTVRTKVGKSSSSVRATKMVELLHGSTRLKKRIKMGTTTRTEISCNIETALVRTHEQIGNRMKILSWQEIAENVQDEKTKRLKIDSGRTPDSL